MELYAGREASSGAKASGSVDSHKLKALRKRGKATAPQVAVLLKAESTLNLAPPPGSALRRPCCHLRPARWHALSPR